MKLTFPLADVWGPESGSLPRVAKPTSSGTYVNSHWSPPFYPSRNTATFHDRLHSLALLSVSHCSASDSCVLPEILDSPTYNIMLPVLTFGPKGDEWRYDRDAKSYDLTRGVPSPGFTMRATQGPAGTSITLAPTLSALVVVDMQNFFLHPRCTDHPTGLVAAERTIEVIRKCRDIDVKIIWLNWGLNDGDLTTMPASTQRSFSSSLITPPIDSRLARYGFGSDMGDGRGRMLMEGSWNARLYDPLQDICRLDSDVFCNKNRISGLWNGETPLAKALAAGGYRTLLFAGVNTDQCVLGTLADAHYQGWDCIMVDDCCATKTPGGQDVTVYNAKGYGLVVDSKSIAEGVLGN